MIQSTQALAETVLPPLVRDQPSDAIKCPEDGQPRARSCSCQKKPMPASQYSQSTRQIVHAAKFAPARLGQLNYLIMCCIRRVKRLLFNSIDI